MINENVKFDSLQYDHEKKNHHYSKIIEIKSELLTHACATNHRFNMMSYTQMKK